MVKSKSSKDFSPEERSKRAKIAIEEYQRINKLINEHKDLLIAIGKL
ncbi:MAG: hypothetical protein ACOCRX_02435 [Candidatus Woesearchaeota archaeon]